MERKFKTGDIVKLKSGSPVMTVKCYDPPDGTDVTCSWFWKDQIQEKSFPEDMLTVHQPIKPSDFFKTTLR